MKNKKILKLLGVIGVAGIVATGGTIAYLTDYDYATNVFTVGEVEIDLTEPNFEGNDDPTDTDGTGNNPPDKIVLTEPTEIIKKDPQITNEGTNPCYVYMEVKIPVVNTIEVHDDGTRAEDAASNHEVLTFNTTFIDTTFDIKKVSDGKTGTNQWMLLDKHFVPTVDPEANGFTPAATGMGSEVNGLNSETATRGAVGYEVYTFAYNTTLLVGETTKPIFDKVKIMNFVEDESNTGTTRMEGAELQLGLRAYAIQTINTDSEGNTGATNAGNANNDQPAYDYDEANGETIAEAQKGTGYTAKDIIESYNLYANQNSDFGRAVDATAKANILAANPLNSQHGNQTSDYGSDNTFPLNTNWSDNLDTNHGSDAEAAQSSR